MITRESLRVLENNLTFTKFVRRDFDDSFGRAGAKIGTVLNIRKPPRYVGRVGQGLHIEDATETSVPLVLNTQRGVDIAFTSQDLALSIDDFSDRFIKPAIANVANYIDFDGLSQYLNVYNTIGTPGTVPSALLTYLQAGQRLDEEAAPRDNQRSLVISPAMQATIVDALKGLFHSSTEIEEQYESGTMGLTIGFKWSMDQNTRTHTIGGLGGTPAVASVPADGATTLATSGWTASTATVKRGDVFTIGGGGTTPVNAVNPQNRQNTGALRQFVITADVTSDSGGLMTLPIDPPFAATGAFQTITQLPTTGSTNGALTFFGAASTVTPQGLAFHKD